MSDAGRDTFNSGESPKPRARAKSNALHRLEPWWECSECHKNFRFASHELIPKSCPNCLAIFGSVDQPFPKIVCLCGSTHFTEKMLEVSWTLAKQGIITLSWNVLPHEPASHRAEAEGVKAQIDELFKRKIDLADEVLVINVGGYIGESTQSEIEYARAHCKRVYYLEPPK